MTDQELWLSAPGDRAAELSRFAVVEVEGKIKGGSYTRDEIAYIQKVQMSPIPKGLAPSEQRLEKLRRLCRTWEVEIKPEKITSHRKIIGPFIVQAKKMLLPILQILLKDLLRQQREFNAAAISLLAELSSERKDMQLELFPKD